MKLFMLTLWLSLALTPSVGDMAPDFTAKDIHGQSLHLAELVKKGPVVLVFFPKAFTSGCTSELKAFQARINDLNASLATVVAISTDEPQQLRRFQAQLGASFHFVSDAEGRLVKLYDTKFPVINMAARRTFVVGKQLKVLAMEEGFAAVDPAESIAACKSATQHR